MKVDTAATLTSSSPGDKQKYRVCVILGASGYKRTFGFNSDQITAEQLKQRISSEASPDLLAHYSNPIFFLDEAGNSVDEKLDLDADTETRVMLFSLNVDSHSILEEDTSRLQVPKLELIPLPSAAGLQLRNQECDKLYEYYKTLYAYGRQGQFIRDAAAKRYQKLNDVPFIAVLGDLINAQSALCARLRADDDKLTQDINILSQQIEQLQLIVSHTDQALDQLRTTKLVQSQSAQDPNKECLGALLPFTDLTNLRSRFDSLQPKFDKLKSDHLRKMTPELLSPNERAVNAFADLKRRIPSLEQQLVELDATLIRNEQFIQKLRSALSTGRSADIIPLLSECQKSGTTEELRKCEPPSISSGLGVYNSIQTTYNALVSLTGDIQTKILEQLEAFALIKVMQLAKDTNMNELRALQSPFLQIRTLRTSYEAALHEVQRRTEFRESFKSFLANANERIKAMCDHESSIRSQFSAAHVQNLDPKLFPGITDLPSFTAACPTNFDDQLPKVDIINDSLLSPTTTNMDNADFVSVGSDDDGDNWSEDEKLSRRNEEPAKKREGERAANETEELKKRNEVLQRELNNAKGCCELMRDNLSRVAEQKEGNIRELEARNKELSDLVSQLLPRIECNPNVPPANASQNDASSELIRDFSAQIESLQFEIDSHKMELTTRNNTIQELESVIEEHREQAAARKLKIQQLETENAKLREQSATHIRNVQQLETENSQLKAQLAALMSEKEKEQKRSNDATERTQELNRHLRILEQKLKLLDSEKQLAQSEVSSLKTEITKLNGRIHQRSNSDAVLTDADSTRNELIKLNAHLTEKTSQLESATAQITNLTKELQVARCQIDKAQNALNNATTQHEAEIEKVRRDLAQARVELQRCLQDNEAKTKQINSTVAKLTQITSDLETSKQDSEAKTQQLNTTAARLAQANSEIEAAKRDNAAKARQYNLAMSKKEQADAELEASRRELAAKSQQLRQIENQAYNLQQRARLAYNSLSCCAGGLGQIASLLSLHGIADSMRGTEENPETTGVNPQAVISIIDTLSTVIRRQNRENQDQQDPANITVKIRDFQDGDKILFLPVQGSGELGMQQFFAFCGDHSAQPCFLSEETLVQYANMRSRPYLIGECVWIEQNMAAGSINPYRLSTGAAYTVIHARLS